MTSRKPLVVGNWKMNTTVPEGVDLARAVAAATHFDSIEVGVLPPFTHLWLVAQALTETHVGVGAQNLYWEEKGAFTGEISPAMLRGWCRFVLVGHSERRHVFGETDQDVNRKLHAALRHQLRVIVAVGETEAERDAGTTVTVVNRQLDAGFAAVDVRDLARIDVAYEPVWAIGTGKTATPAEAQDVCAQVRCRLTEHFGTPGADVRVLYGGSVTAANAVQLFGQADIDGGLIGGASLKVADFAAIVAAAKQPAGRMG